MMKNLYKDVVYYFSLLGYLGFVMIFNILFFIIIYKVVEKYFISSDLLFIVFTIIGIFSGLYNSYKLIMKKK
ncbi:AtpZ/AtpI family protein [uncultured Ilyobacter sp.]|uniref:AtpZ/AtpI family protein n=1 Tax=uncultured Ilyobacter sp. TaxID=544433 RepID=UPI0037488E29